LLRLPQFSILTGLLFCKWLILLELFFTFIYFREFSIFILFFFVIILSALSTVFFAVIFIGVLFVVLILILIIFIVILLPAFFANILF
jgi:hypothetical protein